LFLFLPDLALAGVQYGKKHAVPVLVDIRDLWPEVFIDVAPAPLKKLTTFALFPLFNQVKRIFKQATGLIGLTKAFLDIGLQKNKKSKSETDAVFPLAYEKTILSEAEIATELVNWQNKGINCANKFTICFFGSIGHHSDLETIIEAAKRLEIDYPSVQFIFCGVGDTFEKFKKLSSALTNIYYPGFIGRKEIISLMKVSKLGIIPYKSTINYQNNITNKAIEYLSEGLPIVTGLTGYFRDFVLNNKIGLVYENGNANSLFQLIKSLIDDTDSLNDLSKNALALYERDFEADKVYTKYMNHLEKVVENHKNN
jgi:glycosyltransferase involved in cell wall biosynthesis